MNRRLSKGKGPSPTFSFRLTAELIAQLDELAAKTIGRPSRAQLARAAVEAGIVELRKRVR